MSNVAHNLTAEAVAAYQAALEEEKSFLVARREQLKHAPEILGGLTAADLTGRVKQVESELARISGQAKPKPAEAKDAAADKPKRPTRRNRKKAAAKAAPAAAAADDKKQEDGAQ